MDYFYYFDGKKVAGPHSLSEIQEMFAMEMITTRTPVVRAGEQDWQTLGAYCDLNELERFIEEDNQKQLVAEELRYQKLAEGADEQAATKTLKKWPAFTWSKTFLLFGLFVIAAASELWQRGLRRNPQFFTFTELVGVFGNLLPEITGGFCGALLVGYIGSLLANKILAPVRRQIASWLKRHVASRLKRHGLASCAQFLIHKIAPSMPENKWNVFIVVAYVALILSIVGRLSPK